MANEADLKKKLRRHAEKQGFHTLALSPHQIRGMPDIRVVDLGRGEAQEAMYRVRQHLVEAKVAKLGPQTDNVFEAKRDATPHQTLWLLNDTEVGLSAWWLILSDDHWLLVRGDVLEVSRITWDMHKRKYGAEIDDLAEPESDRLKRFPKLVKKLSENRLKVARLYD